MTQIDFTMSDLKASSVRYEEGQDVTPEVLKSAEKAYQFFHDKYLALKPKLSDLRDIHYSFIFHDVSLAYFVSCAKDMVSHGRKDSLEIFGCYLEYLDSYRDLANLVKNGFKYENENN